MHRNVSTKSFDPGGTARGQKDGSASTKDVGVGKRADTATLNFRESNTSLPNLGANKPSDPTPTMGPTSNAKASNGKTKPPQRVAALRKINTPDAVRIAPDGVDMDNSPQSASKAKQQGGSSLNKGHKPKAKATTGNLKSPTRKVGATENVSTGKPKQGTNTRAHTLVAGSDIVEEGHASYKQRRDPSKTGPETRSQRFQQLAQTTTRGMVGVNKPAAKPQECAGRCDPEGMGPTAQPIQGSGADGRTTNADEWEDQEAESSPCDQTPPVEATGPQPPVPNSPTEGSNTCKEPTPESATQSMSRDSNAGAHGDAMSQTTEDTTGTQSDAGSEDYGVPRRRETQPGPKLGNGKGGAHGSGADKEMDSNDELFRTPDNGTEAMEATPRERAHVPFSEDSDSDLSTYSPKLADPNTPRTMGTSSPDLLDREHDDWEVWLGALRVGGHNSGTPAVGQTTRNQHNRL